MKISGNNLIGSRSWPISGTVPANMRYVTGRILIINGMRPILKKPADDQIQNVRVRFRSRFFIVFIESRAYFIVFHLVYPRQL